MTTAGNTTERVMNNSVQQLIILDGTTTIPQDTTLVSGLDSTVTNKAIILSGFDNVALNTSGGDQKQSVPALNLDQLNRSFNLT
jgi:hypothetical protein